MRYSVYVNEGRRELMKKVYNLVKDLATLSVYVNRNNQNKQRHGKQNHQHQQPKQHHHGLQ